MHTNLGAALLPVLAGLTTTIGGALGFFSRKPGPRATALYEADK